MPRWKALPDALDPQLREFVEQLRRVVDDSGLSVATVADRTGYGKASWERYLNGRLLAPKGAVVALAEVTGTPPVHLTTLWELAERAWSRSELVPATAAAAADTATDATADAERVATGASRGAGAQRTWMFLAGVVGVVIVVVGAFLLTDGGDPRATVGGSPESSSSTPADPRSSTLPAGVLCAGADCTGKDAEEMGCSGDLVTTAKSATVGPTLVEVRYSRTCGTAWGRIMQAGQGDEVRVTVGSAARTGTVTDPGETIAYTPMVAVKDAKEATACAVLASGQTGCTP
ncbi:XRE family transcriptional regulator [Streptomyces sp. NBC_01275]|uniref:helix-turn-helix domain-containing protein n=1 Tax=Streptomyces sp. NBC_01275 TaxID=2903807 RepID=UPI002258DEBA|nr:XRE family transcriptional regulator [Streptomyces sp. NBC_01275]MCX4764477.1 XRE family transcriptional regulator [Streptomyces sp. NBC_01275]